MAKRVTFFGDRQALPNIALHHADLANSLREYFHPLTAKLGTRFAGSSKAELNDELSHQLIEIELSSSLTLLASVEASFKIDYLQRCQLKKKDANSRAFWEIYKKKERWASLEEDIFGVWAETSNEAKAIIGELRGAFKFRHWLAHGRYWNPKLGRRYDFSDVYTIADTALDHFDLIT